MKNIFDLQVTNEIIDRINQLRPDSSRVWGSMSVAQMLAHCNVTYEMLYEKKHPKPGAIQKFFLKLFVKSVVVNDKPYKKNGRTAPQFLVSDDKDFDTEKTRLVNYIKRTQEFGDSHFDNRASHSFGKLTKKEWSNMFYKHLDHHLNQFGV